MWSPSTQRTIRQKSFDAQKEFKRIKNYPFYVRYLPGISKGNAEKIGFETERNAKEFLDHVCSEQLLGRTRYLTQTEVQKNDPNALFGIESVVNQDRVILCTHIATESG